MLSTSERSFVHFFFHSEEWGFEAQAPGCVDSRGQLCGVPRIAARRRAQVPLRAPCRPCRARRPPPSRQRGLPQVFPGRPPRAFWDGHFNADCRVVSQAVTRPACRGCMGIGYRQPGRASRRPVSRIEQLGRRDVGTLQRRGKTLSRLAMPRCPSLRVDGARGPLQAVRLRARFYIACLHMPRRLSPYRRGLT